MVGVDPDIVRETLDCLAADAWFSAIKVGMLGNGAVADVIHRWLAQRCHLPVVLDPVAKSSNGKDLLDAFGRNLLRTAFLARVNWITPNLQELADLTETALPASHAEIERAARKLLEIATERGNPGLKVVVTGGHAQSPDDLLLTKQDWHWFAGERIATTSTHGTGCTFSSALAARIALGDDDVAAVAGAKLYVTQTLRHAYPIGRGNGPLNHFWAAHIARRAVDD